VTLNRQEPGRLNLRTATIEGASPDLSLADPFKVSSLSVSRGFDHRLVQCIGHAVKQT
jgi:hypothetical protein